MQEIALYKVSTALLMANPEICEIIRRNDAPIIETNPVYTVVEKAGRTAETEQLRRDLTAFDCLLQYVNSGRIAVTRSSEEHLTEFLKKLNQ